MDLGSLHALRRDIVFSVLGIPVTVTRPAPEHQPIATRGVWQSIPADEAQPHGQDFSRRAPHRVMAILRSAVSELPRGSEIVAPEQAGGESKTWQVVGLDRVDAEHWRVFLTQELR